MSPEESAIVRMLRCFAEKHARDAIALTVAGSTSSEASTAMVASATLGLAAEYIEAGKHRPFVEAESSEPCAVRLESLVCGLPKGHSGKHRDRMGGA